MRSLLFILLFVFVLNLPVPAQQAPPAAPAAPAGPGLTITTVAWPDGDDIPLKYTQAVTNPVSPALTWTNVPAGTRSFVLHMHDPDVAINKTTNTQVHWLVWGIPGTGAIVGATVVGTPTQATIFAYPSGSMMVGRTAPGKRLSFFIHNNTVANVAPDGFKLLDAAVDWMIAP